MTRRSYMVYGLLLMAWLLVIAWQWEEHARVRRSARAAMINRAKDISGTLGLVLRSQRRFGGVVSKERVESTLRELVKPGELNAIALLNAAGEVVASAGPIDHFDPKIGVPAGEHWEGRTVTLMNLVDLGTNVTHDLERNNPTIVIPRNQLFGGRSGNDRPGDHPPPEKPGDDPTDDKRPRGDRSDPRPVVEESGNTNASGAEWPRFRHRGWRPPPPGENGPPPFGRPFWMSEAEYTSIIQEQGVHSFLLVMSTGIFHAIVNADFWLRLVVGGFATVSVLGSGLAWRNLAKSSELQIRLVRASELNSHLKEMNLAAAGLAHETRNPLNLIRGWAQMISRQEQSGAEIRKKSREIIDEADRLTAQLNEFINYSRPREVRRTRLALGAVVEEVVRALSGDIEEKAIDLQTSGDPLTIQADEQLLRQALFNLLLNAVQAVEPKGEIRVVSRKETPSEASLEILDNGPGVPAEHRQDIFKPYFTTYPGGTGLGLAVVHQIVLAHGWEIECLPHSPSGAIFRITHLKLAPDPRVHAA